MRSKFATLLLLMAARGAGAVSMMGLTMLITHTLSVSAAGIALFGISLIMVIGQVSAAGTHQAAIKTTGQCIQVDGWEDINRNLSALTYRVLRFSPFIPVMIGAYAWMSGSLPLVVSLLIGMGGACFGMAQIYSGAFIGSGRVNLGTFLLNGLSSTIALLLLWSLILVMRPNEVNVIFIFSLATLLTMLLSFGLWSHQPKAHWIKNALPDQTTISVAKASHPSVIFQLSTQYAAQFTVATMLSAAQVAEFTTALRVALLIAFVLMAANLMIAGRLANLHAKGDIEGINRLTKQTSQLLLIFSIPLLLIIWVGARHVMGLFGAAYESSAIILQILAIGQFINVLTGPTSMILTMCGGEFDQRRVLFITFIVSTLAAIVLTHLYGLVGAAIATALGVSSQNLMAAYYVHKRLGFNVLNPFRIIK